MQSVKLRISRDEFYVIDQLCTNAFVAAAAESLRPMLTVNTVLLAEHCLRTNRLLYNWTAKTSGKLYAFTVPTSVALSLRRALLTNCPNHAGQTLLATLDQTLVNLGYRAETAEQL